MKEESSVENGSYCVVFLFLIYSIMTLIIEEMETQTHSMIETKTLVLS